MSKVTGIGGIFFRAKDPESIKRWYNRHLGFKTDQWGTMFEWRHAGDPQVKGHTQWSPMEEDTEYLNPSEKQFMINYRVDNLEVLVGELRSAGVTICDEIEEYEYGKFIHILDPEGNKIELWEPVDEGFK